MSIPPQKTPKTIDELNAELEKATRMLSTALKEVRESRTFIGFQAREIAQQSLVIEHQNDDIIEWMHAADANKRLAEFFLAKSISAVNAQEKAEQLAECIVASAQADPRFGHTALLVYALEYFLEKQEKESVSLVHPSKAQSQPAHGTPWPF